MSIPSVLDDLDLTEVLAPIPGDLAAGLDPRDDVSPKSIYYRIRDARSEAREAERRRDSDHSSEGGEDGGAAVAWRTVRSLAEQGLKTVAKDLEFATWLTEALVRTAGFCGLATGAAVIAGLIEGYWDNLYPSPDEDGVATRVSPLAGLSGQGVEGTLIQPLRKAALFRRPDGSPFTYWEYMNTVDLAAITDPDRRRQRIEANVLPFEEMEAEARLLPAAHWAELQADLTTALDNWTAMATLLDAKTGSDSISMARVRDLLMAMQAAASRFAPAARDADQTATPAEAAAPGVTSRAGLAHGATAAVDRDTMLRQLEEIARWFMLHEPNSPLAYTLDEAVRRARMPWPELLLEVMPDHSSRNALLTSLGTKPQTE